MGTEQKKGFISAYLSQQHAQFTSPATPGKLKEGDIPNDNLMLRSEVRELSEKVDKLTRLIEFIFANHIVIDGKLIDINKL